MDHGECQQTIARLKHEIDQLNRRLKIICDAQAAFNSGAKVVFDDQFAVSPPGELHRVFAKVFEARESFQKALLLISGPEDQFTEQVLEGLAQADKTYMRLIKIRHQMLQKRLNAAKYTSLWRSNRDQFDTIKNELDQIALIANRPGFLQRPRNAGDVLSNQGRLNKLTESLKQAEGNFHRIVDTLGQIDAANRKASIRFFLTACFAPMILFIGQFLLVDVNGDHARPLFIIVVVSLVFQFFAVRQLVPQPDKTLASVSSSE